MFAPDFTTHELVRHVQHERLSHAARLRMIARERSADSNPVDRHAQRRMTVRRLAGTLGAAAVALMLVAAAGAAL